VLFVVGLLIGGAAPTMAVLIGGRVVQGFASGMLGSVAYAVIRLVYPEEIHPRILALWASAWVIPGLVGPAIAGLVAKAFDWRWVFFGLIPFAFFAVALTAQPLRAIPAREGRPRDLKHIRDALVLALGVSGFLTGIGRDNVLLGAALVIAGVAIAVPPFRRLAPPGTLRAAPGPGAGVISILLLNIGFFGAEAFIPLALTDLRDRSPAFAGLPLTAAALTWTAGAWMLDRWSTRIRRRTMVRIGLMLVTAGIVIFLLVLRPQTPVAVTFLSWAVAGLGMGLAFSTLQLIVLDSATEGQEGIATAGMQLANSLGIAISAGVGGAVVSAFSSGDEATATGIVVQSLLMSTALVAGWFVAARLPERASSR
jgi:MFS family permease